MTEPYRIADYPAEAFLFSNIPLPGAMRNAPQLWIRKIEPTEKYGPLWWMDGLAYPRKGRMNPRLVQDLDQVKKYLKGWLGFLSDPPIRYFLPLLILIPPFILKKIFNRWLFRFDEFTMNTLQNHFLEKKWLCNVAQEVWDLGMKIFGKTGGSLTHYVQGTKESTDRIGKNMVLFASVFIDTEIPYRTRLMDIAQLIDVEAG